MRANKISAIKPDVYSLFVFLIQSSSIGRISISQQLFKILEYKSLNIMDSKRRVGSPLDESRTGG